MPLSICETYCTSSSTGVSKKKQLAILLSDVQEYECAKAYFKVKLDSDRFEQMNTGLSSEWDDIERRIVFDEDAIAGNANIVDAPFERE